MVKQISCREAGMDCEFLIRDENEDELVDLVQQHAERSHNTELADSDVRDLMVEVER